MKFILDFGISSGYECRILSFGWFSEVLILCADVSEHSVCSIFIGGVPAYTSYEDGVECSETSTHKTKTPGNYSKDRILQNMFHLYLYVEENWIIYTYIYLYIFH